MPRPPSLLLTALLLTGCSGAPDALPTPEPEAKASGSPPATTPGTRWVAPGLVDAHAHPQSLGRHLGSLRLNDLPTLAATLAATETAAGQGEGWVLGRGWDQNDWTDHEGFPTAAHLDAVVPDRPVALRRVDGHATWVNTAALTAAGITAQTPDPEGGRILRDAAGAPTGVLVDAAVALLPEQPEPGPEVVRRQLELGLSTMAAAGLTGAHDMGVSDAALAQYESLDAEGRLPLRIFAYLDADALAVERLKASGPWCGTHLCVVGVKAYADGALGSRGARLAEDYADEPGHRGAWITPPEQLQAEAEALLRSGAQLAVHAIGDEAVRGVLDAFAAAREAVPEAAAVPLRIEHFQVARPEDLPRLRALNVVASMQPTHATSDMPWAEARLGPERVGHAYAWRDVIETGGLLAFGSDFPVEEVSPSFGLWSATRRQDLEGQPPSGWRPTQKLSLAEATRAFSASTYAALPPAIRDRVDASDDRTVLVAEDRAAGTWWTPVEVVVDGVSVWSAAATP